MGMMLDAGFWILKDCSPYFIQHQVSSILPLMAQTLILKIFPFLVPARPSWLIVGFTFKILYLTCVENRHKVLPGSLQVKKSAID
jgi:hypothetical protein